MGRIQAAEALVKILENEGVEAIFGIPGAGHSAFLQCSEKSSIKHYLARHE
ncbi:unnamed protein product, partial [marine sediment metagenome]